MSTPYTEVTVVDPVGRSLKVTCYPKLYSLLQQIEHHYNELCKNKFCVDKGINRKELINYGHEYMSSRQYAEANAFSLGNVRLRFDSEFLDNNNYDHTLMMDDDVLEMYACRNPYNLQVEDVMLKQSCAIQSFYIQETRWCKLNCET